MTNQAERWQSKLCNYYDKKWVEDQHGANLQLLKKLRMQPENARCVDCFATDGSNWVALHTIEEKGEKHHFGGFVCVRCASLHRGVGTHVSKVKGCSGTYLWGPDELQSVENGNKKIAEIYGGVVPGNGASDAVVRQFILDRYDTKKWLNMNAVFDNGTSSSTNVASTGATSNITGTSKIASTQAPSFDLLDFGEPNTSTVAANLSSKIPYDGFDPFGDHSSGVGSNNASAANQNDPFAMFDNIGNTTNNQGAVATLLDPFASVTPGMTNPGGHVAKNTGPGTFNWPDAKKTTNANQEKKRDALDDFFDSL